MQSSIKLGRVFGIEIGLHYSWFLIALLITLSLVGQFHAEHAKWGENVIWLAAVVTGLLFFAALILHELSHALTARARGLPVGAITLFALGGVSRIEREPEKPSTEFLIGIVGPLTSAAVGVVCLLLAGAIGWRPSTSPATPPQAVMYWLGYINFALAVFNLIPGYPLDGGRVLRSLAWWITGDAARATRFAARGGQAVAYLFIVYGLFLFFFSRAGLNGLWIAFIGWFLLNAAGASYGQVQVLDRLRGVRVADVMERNCARIGSQARLQELVDDLLRSGRRCFVVVDGAAVVGLITPHEVKQVPRERWGEVAVAEAMRPLDRLHTVSPDSAVADSLEIMAREDVHQLPVVVGGRLEGVVSRGDVIRVLKTREQLGA